MSHFTSSNTPTILTFSKENQRRIWDKPKHRKESIAKLRRFCNFADFESRPIDAYSPSLIYDFLEYREDYLGNSAGTLNRYIAALSKVFNFYYDEIGSGTPPRLKWRKETGGRPRSFSVKEQKDLTDIFFDGRHPWSGHLVTLMLKTGMRTMEAVNIGLEEHEVGTDDTFGVVSKDRTFVTLKRTKNGTERKVPLSKEAYKALDYLDCRPSNYFSHHQWYEDWRRAKRIIAPNDATFVPHVCRHTAATNLASHGFNMKMIGLLLGHKSIVTTAKYVHEDADTMKKMVDSLSGVK
jgi:integrase